MPKRKPNHNIAVCLDMLSDTLRRKEGRPFSRDTCLELHEEIDAVQAFALTPRGQAFDAEYTHTSGYYLLKSLRCLMRDLAEQQRKQQQQQTTTCGYSQKVTHSFPVDI